MKTVLQNRKLSFWIFAGLALAGAVSLAVAAAQIWPFTVDDSFITFRYSRNLAAGIGPAFNAVGQRAEGYTSFLWMVVMAAPHALHFGVISFAKLVGLLAMLGVMGWMAVFLWHAGVVEERGYRLGAAGLVSLFFGLLPETAIHAVSGMETSAYIFLLTGLVTLAYLALKGSRAAQNWLPLMALAAGLARPEANLTAVLLISTVFYFAPRRKSFLLRVALLYVLPGALYFFWRWQYFGVFLPLPFYIKTGGPGLPGLGMVRSFVIFLLANLGIYMGIGMAGEKIARRLLLLALLPNLAFFLFSYPVMEYDYRFLYPLLPLALLLTGMGLAMALKLSQERVGGRLGALAPAWLGVLVVMMFASQNLPRDERLFAHKLDYVQGMARAHYAIGHILSRVTHDSATPVLAVTDAGAMPYYSGWRTIDGGGLNDASIALNRVDPLSYIFQQQPEVLVLTSTSLAVFENDSLYAQALFHAGLEHGLVVVARTPFYQGDTIWVLARPGGAAAHALSAGFADQ
jgi:arabinofuranosyltransferase